MARPRPVVLALACWAAFGLASSPVAHAQSVTLSLRPADPTRFELSALWAVDLVSTGPASADVFLRATVTEASRGVVLTAHTAVRTFAPGSHSLRSTDFEPIVLDQTEALTRDALSRAGRFPDGDYTICVEAVPASGGGALAQSCVAERVASVLPPILLGPYNGTDVTDPIIVWTWFMQPSSASGEAVECDLVVAEILPHQTPEEALRVNAPVLVREGLRSSAWQTNEAVRKFVAGRRYAWRLRARTGTRVASESEIWTFTYAQPTGASADSALASLADAPPGALSAAVAEEPAPPYPPPAVAAEGPPIGPTDALAPAAANPDPLRLSVASRLTLETSNRPGALSGAPREFARLQIDPTLRVHETPLELSFLVSTAGNDAASDIQRGALGFSSTSRDMRFGVQQRIGQRLDDLRTTAFQQRADSLRQAAGDPALYQQQIDQLETLQGAELSESAQELAQLGILSPAEAALMKFSTVAVGSVVPQFSPLLMSGATITGGLIEYDPGRFYGAIAGGKIERSEDVGAIVPLVLSRGDTNPSLFRDILVVRAGAGRRAGNHLILSGLMARDDGQSEAIVRLADPSVRPTLQENWIAGLAGRAAAADGRYILDGEINGALFSTDRDGAQVQNRPAPGFLRSLFGSRVREGSALDWAGALKGTAAVLGGSGRLVSGLQFVGPGYTSVGVKGLRKDVLQANAGYDQTFFQRRLLLGGQIGYEETGVVLPQFGGSLLRHWSGRLQARPARLGAFDAAFLQNEQDVNPGGGFAGPRNRQDQIQLRYSRRTMLGRLNGFTFVTVDAIEGRSDDPSGRHRSRNVNLDEIVMLGPRLSLRSTLGRTETETALAGDSEAPVWSTQQTLIHGSGGAFQSSFGANLSRSRDTRGHGVTLEEDARLWRGTRLGLQFEYGDFRDERSPSRNRVDRIARLVLRSGG